ncbi:hypothetical protein THRCLA_10439 [Thraustotheca clavata]|uniref:Uncharacterized protein n=1 Tax=Thraustotheca clavata TaxID=74557 RepID=A0A1V9YPM7_9STRA|nr:hypothetical protein THRCLA_10439 [Thraustotheca clavata]
MLTCQMWSVWVLCVVTKTILYIISFFSIGFSIRLLSIRNTDVLKHTQVAQRNDIGAIRQSHTIPSNYRYWGLYLDARCLFMAFIVLYVLLMLTRVRAVRSPSRVPYAVKTFCNHTMFSTSWNTLFIDRFVSDDGVSKIRNGPDRSTILCEKTSVLMNIAWMTDPIEYLLSRFWNHSTVYFYRDKATDEVFLHPLSPDELKLLAGDVEEFLLMEERKELNEVPWSERIYCC